MAERKALSAEQKRIQDNARTVVKVIGMLEGLDQRSLETIQDAAARRIPKPQAFPHPSDTNE